MNRATAILTIAHSRGVPSSAVAGARLARPRGVAEIIGAHVLQTPGGIQGEMEQINSDILTFGHELSETVTGAGTGFPHTPSTPLEDFFANVWSPWYQHYESWYGKHNGWWHNLWWNEAPAAEEYRSQLLQLRAQARTLGMAIQSPEPNKPPPGLLESFGLGLWAIVKGLLWLGLGIVSFSLMLSWAKRARR